jgi:lactose/L-arabinose transport system permease protein
VTNFFTQVDVPLVFWNSTKVAVLATVLTIVVSSLAGYGFEMFKSKARERVYSLVLLTLMIPFGALMIPLFMMMAKSGLINTHIAIMLPTIASAFIIFYFRQSTKAFPTELRDAAKVDGLKEWQIFFYIYMPVMRSTYAAAFVIVFMTNWNNYLWPLIVLQSNETKTITLVVSSLASAYYPDYGVVMIGTILATLPTLFVFFVMQRQFVQGMLGSVK